MYKLLLVTDRDDITEAFSGVQDWGRLMFEPVITLNNTPDAIVLIDRNNVDAAGYALANQDAGPLKRHLEQAHPLLPVYHPRSDLKLLREELRLVREHLDRLHADFSDDDYDVEMAVERVRDDLMRRLLMREVKTREELESRLSLSRAPFAADKHSFLYELHLPEGEQYLHTRWRYGLERLETALRSNFLGRFVEDVYYGGALIDPGHLRVIACQMAGVPEEDLEALGRRVQDHVNQAIQEVKAYMDLDLLIAQYTMIDSLNDLVPENGG
ncbi:MAG: hypothetical protein PHP02_04465 [Eubacteriales bacterium]|nr:hypothetical protein [Eubacteriales bacterium]